MRRDCWAGLTSRTASVERGLQLFGYRPVDRGDGKAVRESLAAPHDGERGRDGVLWGDPVRRRPDGASASRTTLSHAEERFQAGRAVSDGDAGSGSAAGNWIARSWEAPSRQTVIAMALPGCRAATAVRNWDSPPVSV